MKLKPISEVPDSIKSSGTPIIAHYPNMADPNRRFAVVYWDEGAYLWRTVHGRSYIGVPTGFEELGEG